ncbi:MAG TPA: DUF1003 domain-containing protein [Solirubrobacteraceae bacterium]|nr:DUF1003 domain-containing protein [Solirubrobacteraceae bacterium]
MAHKDNLGTPRGAAVRSGYDADAFARFAEAIARFLGTGRYLAGQTVFVLLWIALNVIGIIGKWDPYPFILLNLAFSTQAAYAAPLILLAQNRQADRDKEEVERDRETNARALAETEFLARELAGLRLTLEQKADRDDVSEPLDRLARAIEQLAGVPLAERGALEVDGEDGLSAPGDYSAESSHQ